MTSQEKKAYILLKCVIFHYHGLDEDEKKILQETADALDAHQELEWANSFIGEDYYNAFERAREVLQPTMLVLEKPKRLEYLSKVWNANMTKGYISEMEAMAMIKLAKDWDIEAELIESIKK
ncbi:hypothetical protein [Bernardetia sp.]|uniref:hypothetical protein n=1 Tax=Bernardetia sp. TaxID=1937974 RepID=UPI0025C56F9D|nr:hypothetical protein [Bernardetia sp.]